MIEKWDLRFLDMARGVAQWSKDPSTKVGAVAIDAKRQVLSQGYNGFPRGFLDTPGRYEDREFKYRFVVHAEMNCIYNAGHKGVSLDGATLYVDGLPLCHHCAPGVVQSGIKRVVMRCEQVKPKWEESFEHTKFLFNECGVTWELHESFGGRSQSVGSTDVGKKAEHLSPPVRKLDAPVGHIPVLIFEHDSGDGHPRPEECGVGPGPRGVLNVWKNFRPGWLR